MDAEAAAEYARGVHEARAAGRDLLRMQRLYRTVDDLIAEFTPQEREAERIELQRRRMVCWLAAEGRRWQGEHPGRRSREGEVCSVEPVSKRCKHE